MFRSSYMFENVLPRARGRSNQMEHGGPSSEQQQPPNQCPKKRSYRYITKEQTEELDDFFKMNRHPNEKERKELGNRLELSPSKIKFWFQNKRNKVKAQSQREENKILKAENENLQAENEKLRTKMEIPVTCNGCGTRAPPCYAQQAATIKAEQS